MRRLALVLAILVLTAGAFAAGYYLHSWRGTTNTSFMPWQKAQLKTPPEWTEWQYPDSKEQGSGKGGGGTVNGLTAGPIYSVSLTTPDDLDKVLKWYAKKFDNDIIAVPTGSGSLGKMNTENKEDPIINADVLLASTRPNEERDNGTLRPVQMKVISVRTPRYDLVINVSRAEGESHTHIIVTYFPNLPGE